MNINKKTISIILLSIWSMFSVIYIVWDRWSHFKNEQLTQAYNLGKADTVNAAIKQAENDKCEPFSIYNNDKQVQIINVKCLKPAESSGAEKK